MSVSEVLITTVFGIILPSADVGSDLWLAIRILTLRDWQCGLAITKISSQDSALDINAKMFYENQHIYGVDIDIPNSVIHVCELSLVEIGKRSNWWIWATENPTNFATSNLATVQNGQVDLSRFLAKKPRMEK